MKNDKQDSTIDENGDFMHKKLFEKNTRQHLHSSVVAMDTSLISSTAPETRLRNELVLGETAAENEREQQRERNREYLLKHDDQTKNDNYPNSNKTKENLENLIYLKRALIKHNQNEVPGDYQFHN